MSKFEERHPKTQQKTKKLVEIDLRLNKKKYLYK